MKAKHLGRCQADALEQLAKRDLKRMSPGWTVLGQPLMPVIPHPTVRSLANRGLCRIKWRAGRETARITQGGRKVWGEIQAARARIWSAAWRQSATVPERQRCHRK